MAVKLTKNELKVQKDRLKQFQRYLPTLQLKKQQLQSVVMQVTAQLEKVEAERLKIVDGLDGWIAVFAENGSFPEGMRLDSLIRPKDVVCRDHNIAGVIVPVFEELTFEEISYDVADYPLWVDKSKNHFRIQNRRKSYHNGRRSHWTRLWDAHLSVTGKIWIDHTRRRELYHHGLSGQNCFRRYFTHRACRLIDRLYSLLFPGKISGE